ncbi:MAG TPA: phosphomevalonate kinase [Bacillota bacterium]|nr:phosphomevalonate kinase [Bacillota bacterium]
MQDRRLKIKVPGKLMVAGEFAVLEPYQTLAVMAVDRFVYATVDTSHIPLLSLDNFELYDITWTYANKKVTVHSKDKRVRFVENALTIVCIYLQEQAIPIRSVHISIRSELDDASGKKYGLGSSAAVVTAVVAAMLTQHFKEKPPASLVFKLAAIAHVITQGNGSGADVAASAYGGMLQYASFQAEWLIQAYENAASLTELIEMNWLYFSIAPIQLPADLHICIGWTGKPASTAKRVEQVLTLKQTDAAAYQTFLTESKRAVDHFLTGVQKADVPLLLKGVKQNRRALREVGERAHADIETPLLSRLCDLAEYYGGAGKPSGAGGGDCGIAFMPTSEKAAEVMQAWEKNGIKPLALKLYPYGARSNV